VQAFPLSDVKAYMGHADIQTTMIYVHHVPQHDAADRLGRLVAAQAAAVPGVSDEADFAEAAGARPGAESARPFRDTVGTRSPCPPAPARR
jgi:hypothetical protein